MAAGLLIITHNGIGAALLETAIETVGACPLAVEILSAPKDSDPDALLSQAHAGVARLDRGNGVLVLTDLYGSTPCNIARRLMEGHSVCIVAGLNLPMLIRLFNYPDLNLGEMTAKAVSGGHDGVFEVKRET